MKHIFGLFVAALVVSMVPAMSADPSPAIIPLPQKLRMSRDKTFRIDANTLICPDAHSEQTAQYLAQQLRRNTGLSIGVMGRCGKAPRSNFIILTTKHAGKKLGDEGYHLIVRPKGAVIRAATQAGLFYGAQTLMQLLPARGQDWSTPCAEITDWPRFKWRGYMLDVSRHFFNKKEIEAMLDAMALHKLNVFHWHLVDDQGWRIEIKKYPLLTEVGAWRKGINFGLDPKSSTAYGADGRYGGFYTQEEIREIVKYAADRHITIVPEIEMPGHSVAALSAYPQYSCTGGPYNTDLSGGIFRGVYCAGNDDTFQFLQGVLSEIFDLFPSRYIHIGGDEVPADNWAKCEKCRARMKEVNLKDARQLETYFIHRMADYVNAHGHKLIGWTEINDGGLPPDATLMDWKGGAAQAARAGHDVVMSPTSHCYFDYYQMGDKRNEPKAQRGYISLERVYEFEPVPSQIQAKEEHHVLGGQANVWTEFIPSLAHVQYMTFPRLCALSEVTWSNPDSLYWEDFRKRLKVHAQRLDAMGINYCKRAIQ